MSNFEQFINKLKSIKLTESEKFVIRQNVIAVKSPYFWPRIFQLVPVIILLIIISSFSLPGVLQNYELQKVFNQDARELEQVALETNNLENELDILEIEVELDELDSDIKIIGL